MSSGVLAQLHEESVASRSLSGPVRLDRRCDQGTQRRMPCAVGIILALPVSIGMWTAIIVALRSLY